MRRQCFDAKRQIPSCPGFSSGPSPALETGECQISLFFVIFIISIRRWRGHLEAPRGFFSLPWKEEKGVSELFFEVRVVGDATRCREEELNVAQLLTGEGAEGDKLLLRGGVLGIQVMGKTLRSATHSLVRLSGLDALNVNLKD